MAIHYFDLAAYQRIGEVQYRLGICRLTYLTLNDNIEETLRHLKLSREMAIQTDNLPLPAWSTSHRNFLFG
jgi:hypothetical protein